MGRREANVKKSTGGVGGSSSEDGGDERWDHLEVPTLGHGILVSGETSQLTAVR